MNTKTMERRPIQLRRMPGAPVSLPSPGKVTDIIRGFEKRIDALHREIDDVLRRQGELHK